MMAFTIQAGALRSAVNQAASVTEARNTIPILAHLRLSGEAGRLTVEADDLQRRLTFAVTGDGDLPAITADARRLAGLLRFAPPEETVTLDVAKEGQLLLAVGALRAKLFTLPAEDWPGWAGPKADAVPTRADVLLRLLDRPRHAVSVEETRYYLNGVFLHPVDVDGAPKLRGVATVGHRLFIATENRPEGWNTPGMIVPRAAVGVLVPLLRALPGDTLVDVAATDLLLSVQARGWCFTAKTIDGTFPDYARAIPAKDGAPVIVHSGRQFASAVAAVAAISDERSRPVKLSNGSGNSLTISAASPDNGETALTVPPDVAAWATDAEHPECGFQARYLADVCRAFPGGFRMEVLDGKSPVRISGAEGLAVLMPMRV